MFTTHCCGEESTCLELLQSHGAGVGPKEQDEGHQGNVRHIITGLSDQQPSELLTLMLGQGRPGGILRLERPGVNNELGENMFEKPIPESRLFSFVFLENKDTTYQISTVCPGRSIAEC